MNSTFDPVFNHSEWEIETVLVLMVLSKGRRFSQHGHCVLSLRYFARVFSRNKILSVVYRNCSGQYAIIWYLLWDNRQSLRDDNEVPTDFFVACLRKGIDTIKHRNIHQFTIKSEVIKEQIPWNSESCGGQSVAFIWFIFWTATDWGQVIGVYLSKLR